MVQGHNREILVLLSDLECGISSKTSFSLRNTVHRFIGLFINYDFEI